MLVDGMTLHHGQIQKSSSKIASYKSSTFNVPFLFRFARKVRKDECEEEVEEEGRGGRGEEGGEEERGKEEEEEEEEVEEEEEEWFGKKEKKVKEVEMPIEGTQERDIARKQLAMFGGEGGGEEKKGGGEGGEGEGGVA
ncbi:hypothetical protein HZH66_003600 [Vespula vulgaris]|uniref:Uncharacterized protein n=1 Tax=Vespula vulgaris TaxID=7454 RepID=A0A836UVW1_VESVU|nr:hypothetical protein HZH66_003600 [Vespula vulgaris]